MKLPEALTLLKTKTKFLVHNTEPYVVNSFLNQIKKNFPDRELNKFYDTDIFAETAMRGEIFSKDGKILVFYEITDENVNQIQKIIFGCGNRDIILAIHNKALPKLKASTLLKTECESIKFDKPTTQEILKWVVGRLQGNEINFKGDVPQRILDLKGDDLYGLETEINKLKHYAGTKEVTVDDCNLVVTDTGGLNVFNLIEKFTFKKRKETFEEFSRYEESKYFQLISVLLTTLDKIHLISLYKEQGKTPDEISPLVSIPKFYLKTKYYPVLSAYSRGKLLKIREYLCDLETKLKLSKYSKKNLFEYFFVRSFAI